MRFLKIFSVLILASALLYIACFAGESSVYKDVIRLHIIANSNSEADQNTKFEVRDFVIEKYSHALSEYSDRNEALKAAEELLPEIEAEINKLLAKKADYICRVKIEDCYFPTKSYGDFSLPNGEYTALKIDLGRAEGENYWCVMFPPLCLSASGETEEEVFVNHGLTKEVYNLMKKDKPVYKVKFKILEILGK